jgi:hypothetical protein
MIKPIIKIIREKCSMECYIGEDESVVVVAPREQYCLPLVTPAPAVGGLGCVSQDRSVAEAEVVAGLEVGKVKG